MAYYRSNRPEVPQTIVQSEQNESEQIQSEQQNLPLNYGADDCTCKHCQQLKTNNIKGKLNHGAPMFAAQLRDNGYIANRVTLPGDIDYIKIESTQPQGAYGV
jgi:hypothetical protein